MMGLISTTNVLHTTRTVTVLVLVLKVHHFSRENGMWETCKLSLKFAHWYTRVPLL